MDSQLLTYLGSFGAPMLALFLTLHAFGPRLLGGNATTMAASRSSR